MLVREFFYMSDKTGDPVEDKIYSPEYDDSIVNLDDVRKTRLTLKQINRVRKSAELHSEEKQKELVFVRQMYGAPPEGDSGIM